MKFAKLTLVGSILFVPALAFGIAQQDPANPPAQQLQQDQAKPAMSSDTVGTIVEVRDDSFSVKKDSDQSVVWFYITPEFKSSWSSELVTGNHVRVFATAGATADRMNASRISAEPASANLDTDREVDTDIDADIDVDKDSVTATIDKDTALDSEPNRLDTHNDADTDNEAIADNSLNQDSDYDNDSDELPRTASSLPEIASLGLLALLGAAAFALVRKF